MNTSPGPCLSDEALCHRWVENPYFQYFCGEEFFAKLLNRARERRVRLAKKLGVSLRQSYRRVGKLALIKHQRYAHAHQFKRANRRCDPAYVQVAIERWQTFTGKQAILDGDGRTFDIIKRERASAVISRAACKAFMISKNRG
jgi:hypothetical protein